MYIVFAIESIVPYSPLSCISDPASASSPYLPPPPACTPDGFAVPSVSHVSSVKTLPESSFAEASAFTAQPACCETASPTLQTAASGSSTSSDPAVKCCPPVLASQCTGDRIATVHDDGVKQAVSSDGGRSAAAGVPLDLLQLAMMNVFGSEEQQNQVLTDVSTG